MVDQPLQSVRYETLASFRFFRPKFDGQAFRSFAHFLRNGIVFSCIELGEWDMEGHLKGKRRVQWGPAIPALVLGNLRSALTTNQIRYLGLAEPGSFSVRSQIIVEFLKSHRGERTARLLLSSRIERNWPIALNGRC